MQVKFKLLREGAKLPERAHGIDVGLDVFTPSEGILRPGPNKIPLGFSCEVPVGYVAAIYPRSGMASGEKTLDLEILQGGKTYLVKELEPNGIGLFAQLPPIDPGYTGEVHAIVYNSSNYMIKYPKHTRFGQLVFYPIAYVQPVLELDNSRGDKGFGSTGA